MKQPAGISTADSLVIVDAIERFCARAGRACYAGYTPEVLRDYIAFHQSQETLAWTREGTATPGGWHITGVGVAWQCDPEDVFRSSYQNRAVFNWQPSDPRGRALFIADVVATTPRALACLLHALVRRFPDWQHKPIYTFRRGRLVYVTHKTLARLYRAAKPKGT